MNYNQASQMIVKYNHLLNKEFKGKTISALVIAPSDHQGLDRLMYMHHQQLSSPHCYHGYDLLDVVIVFNYSQHQHTEVLDKISLTEILPQLKAS